ncbi:hypothetical protein HDU97_007379 [Phlyctochytrium planicorne]|nr:hypothetical protein HDU97_007379 [Phlyctochytrium planicorne]
MAAESIVKLFTTPMGVQCHQVSTLLSSLNIPKPWNVSSETPPPDDSLIDLTLAGNAVGGVVSSIFGTDIPSIDDPSGIDADYCCTYTTEELNLIIGDNAGWDDTQQKRVRRGNDSSDSASDSGDAATNLIQNIGGIIEGFPKILDPVLDDLLDDNVTDPVRFVGIGGVAEEPWVGNGGGKFFPSGDSTEVPSFTTKIHCADKWTGKTIVGIEIRINPNSSFACSATSFPDVQKLPDITKFTITGCDMHGAVIPWKNLTKSLPKLEQLNLVSNNLTGRITSDIGDFAKLVSLRLDGNRLWGPLPGDSTTQGKELARLPSGFEKLDSLKILRIANNRNISGSIPSTISQLTKLRTFDARNTSLTGVIPGTGLPTPLTTCLLPPAICRPSVIPILLPTNDTSEPDDIFSSLFGSIEKEIVGVPLSCVPDGGGNTDTCQNEVDWVAVLNGTYVNGTASAAPAAVNTTSFLPAISTTPASKAITRTTVIYTSSSPSPSPSAVPEKSITPVAKNLPSPIISPSPSTSPSASSADATTSTALAPALTTLTVTAAVVASIAGFIYYRRRRQNRSNGNNLQNQNGFLTSPGWQRDEEWNAEIQLQELPSEQPFVVLDEEEGHDGGNIGGAGGDVAESNRAATEQNVEQHVGAAFIPPIPPPRSSFYPPPTTLPVYINPEVNKDAHSDPSSPFSDVHELPEGRELNPFRD